MLTHGYTPNEINPEINEAKFFIFKAMQYLELNPLCPFKDLCPIYKKAKSNPLLMRR
jgi:hypothetical protein